MLPSNKNPLNRLFKTQGQIVNRQQTNPQFNESLYNINDFLPTSSSALQNSSINLPQRLKTKSSFITKAQSLHKIDKFTASNIQQKVLQQKMNRLKQQNVNLKQQLAQEKEKSQKFQQEVERLKKIIDKIGNKQLRLWSYKYHIEYNPKQSNSFITLIEHKYQLSVQTDDSLYQQGGLKAKDFQDIYRRLNTNPSMIQLNKKGKKQTQNLNLIPEFSLHKNISMINNNKNSTLKVTKTDQQYNSMFKIPKLQDFLGNDNKQNQINRSNIPLFARNPMQINLEKIFQKQKPIKQECIEIYPIEQSYLDGIVGEILCGQQQ